MNAIACVNVHACKITFHHSRIWLRLGEEGRGAGKGGHDAGEHAECGEGQEHDKSTERDGGSVWCRRGVH